MEDVLAWNSEKSGIFSVKSAYKLAYNLQFAEQTATSSTFRKKRIIWSNIWNNNASPKMKVFAWRLAKEALPTNVNKKNRHLNMLDTCDICGEGSEDGFHAVIGCEHSRNLIQAARKDWPVPADALLPRDGPEWFLQLLDKIPKEERGFFIMLLWKNWNDRNAFTHGEPRHSVVSSLTALSALYRTLSGVGQPTERQLKGKCVLPEAQLKGKYVLHQYLLRKMEQSIVKSPRPWFPPDLGWLKVNVDGSFVEATGQASAGMVIRNAVGKVFLSSWRILFHCTAAEDAELMACKEGLTLARNWFQGPLVLETDSTSCIALLKNAERDRSRLAAVVQDSKELMKELGQVKISKGTRDQNKIAHELAQHARRANSSAVWFAGIPSCIEHLLLDRCNFVTH
ncbi:unnamed protein product [Urochloa humidicola]